MSVWSYKIQYGPDGEANYAWLYRGDVMVATMKTHNAVAIVSALAVETESDEPVAWTSTGNLKILRDHWPMVEVIGCSMERTVGNDTPLYARPVPATDGEAERLREALKEAADQLERVHDDAFTQAAGYGLRTIDGRDFSCFQLNVCSEAASKARASLQPQAAP